MRTYSHEKHNIYFEIEGHFSEDIQKEYCIGKYFSSGEAQAERTMFRKAAADDLKGVYELVCGMEQTALPPDNFRRTFEK